MQTPSTMISLVNSITCQEKNRKKTRYFIFRVVSNSVLLCWLALPTSKSHRSNFTSYSCTSNIKYSLIGWDCVGFFSFRVDRQYAVGENWTCHVWLGHSVRVNTKQNERNCCSYCLMAHLESLKEGRYILSTWHQPFKADCFRVLFFLGLLPLQTVKKS